MWDKQHEDADIVDVEFVHEFVYIILDGSIQKDR